jgi:Tol biopolymer transport system component
LPSDLQPHLRALMKGCLEKDPKDRIGDIAVARFLLDRGVLSAVPLSGVKRSRWMTFFPWAAAAVLAALLATTLFQRIARLDEAPRPTPSLLRVDAAVGADASLVTQNYAGEPGAALAISSDGTQLAFVAQPRGGGARLYVRRLDQLTAAPLPGTDGASAPFFSPDGKWLAFFASNRLKKIAVTGGAPVILADAANPRGGSWSEDGTIVFTRIDEGGVTDMWRVAAAGGSAERLVGLGQGEATHRWPQILPGGRAVLYTVSVTTTDYANAWLAVRPLPSGAPHIVQRGAAYGRYLTSGHLVYLHDGTLFAAPFNLTTLTLTGPPVPVVQGVLNNISTGSAQYAVSDTGVLVYTQGGAESGNAAPLAWLTRDGTMTPLRSTPLNWNGVRISPDGNQLAMSVTDTAGHTNIWIYDTARDTITRLTWESGAPRNPVWTSDGKRVTFSGIESAGAVVGGIFWMRADGGREATRLTDNGSSQYPGSWDPSDRFLAFQSAGNQVGIQILPMQGSETLGWKAGTPKVFTNGRQPRFSPDGRWVAYETSESGRIEVCVRPFPGPGGKWQVSTEGGTDAVWSRARHELLYRALDGRIMVASYSTPGDSFQVENPHVWSETPVQARPLQGSSFDLHPDGERVVMAPLGETGATSTHVTLITNFFNELRRLASVTTADNR